MMGTAVALAVVANISRYSAFSRMSQTGVGQPAATPAFPLPAGSCQDTALRLPALSRMSLLLLSCPGLDTLGLVKAALVFVAGWVIYVSPDICALLPPYSPLQPPSARRHLLPRCTSCFNPSHAVAMAAVVTERADRRPPPVPMPMATRSPGDCGGGAGDDGDGVLHLRGVQVRSRQDPAAALRIKRLGPVACHVKGGPVVASHCPAESDCLTTTSPGRSQAAFADPHAAHERRRGHRRGVPHQPIFCLLMRGCIAHRRWCSPPKRLSTSDSTPFSSQVKDFQKDQTV